jgi:hypothetical protein
MMGMTRVSNLKARAALLVVGMLTTLLVLALSACSGGGEAGGGQEQEANARPLPEQHQDLRPGEYRTEEFKPSFSFHVGKGWSSSPPEASDFLEITRGQAVGLNFNTAQEVYKPTKTGSANIVDAPKDMVGWLQQHPYLQTSKPEPVRVGGVKGVEFDVGVGDLPKGYNLTTCSSMTGEPNCVDLVRLSTGGSLFAAEGYPVRVIVLEDLEGETVTIGIFGPASEFEEFVPEAQKVIDTVKWGGS